MKGYRKKKRGLSFAAVCAGLLGMGALSLAVGNAPLVSAKEERIVLPAVSAQPRAAASPLWEGEGTEQSPYLLGSVQDLQELKQQVEQGQTFQGVYFALSADLDCSSLSGWDGIGTVDASHPENSRAFGGILDGRYQGKQYVIRNLTGTDGLFTYLLECGELRSVVLENCRIQAVVSQPGQGVGALVSYLRVEPGHTVSNMSGCSVSGSLSVQGGSGLSYAVGGILGTVGSSTGDIPEGSIAAPVLQGCTSSCAVQVSEVQSTQSSIQVGAVAGYCPTLEQCQSTENAPVSVSRQGPSQVGGVAGRAWELLSCESRGKVELSYGLGEVGGVVGFLENGRASRCRSFGEVQASSAGQISVGGIAGSTEGFLDQSETSGPISVSGQTVFAGGIAGTVEPGGALQGNVSQGSLRASAKGEASRMMAGGVAGYAAGPLVRCEADGTAEITAESGESSCAGGIVGYAASAVHACESRKEVVSQGPRFAGGIAGYAKGEISGCRASGSLSAQGETSSLFAGGIAGLAENQTIQSCTVSGSIQVSSRSPQTRIGGIAGEAGRILTSTSTASLQAEIQKAGKEVAVGGIAGLAASVTDCKGAGEIQVQAGASQAVYTGGIAGLGQALQRCLAAGDVSVQAEGGMAYTGGILGAAWQTAGILPSVDRCAAWNPSLSGGVVHRIVGEPLPDGQIRFGRNIAHAALPSFGQEVDGETAAETGADFWLEFLPEPWGISSTGTDALPSIEASRTPLQIEPDVFQVIAGTGGYEGVAPYDTLEIQALSEGIQASLIQDGGSKYRIAAVQPGWGIVRFSVDGAVCLVPVRSFPLGGSILLDTASYTMAPGDVYDIGVTLRDGDGTQLSGAQVQQMVREGTLRVKDSRTGSVAKLRQLSNGNFRVEGKQPGTCYIVYEILQDGQAVTHASVRIDVQAGVQQHGDAVRNTSYWAQK